MAAERVATSRFRHHLLPVVLLAALAGILFGPHLGQGFYMDDWSLLQQARDHSLWDVLTAGREAAASGDTTRVYWRPAWLAMFQAWWQLFGPDPRFYVLAAVLMHLGNALLVYAIVARFGGARAAGVLGGVLALSFASAAEGVLWIAAAFNVLPAAATTVAAGALSCIAAERRRLGPWGGAIALAALSLCFREFAYALAPLAFAAWCVLRTDLRWARRGLAAAGAALPFAVLTIVHFRFLHGQGGPHSELGPLLAGLVRNVAEHLRHATGLPWGDAALVGGAGAVWAAALWSTRGAGRVAVVWAPLALLPHALIAWGGRLGYHFLLVAGIAGGLLVAQGWRRRALGLVWLAGLLALLGSNVWRHAAAMREQRALGESCRSALAWSRQALPGVERLAVDFVPPELMNGWTAMLDVAAGLHVVVYSAVAIPRPPFAVVFAHVPDGDGVRFARFDRARGTFALVPREQFYGGLLPIPMFAFAADYEVVAPAAMGPRLGAPDFAPVERALLAHDPRLVAGAGRDEVLSFVPFPRPSLDVQVGRLGLLLVNPPFPVDPARMAVTVDGQPAEVIPANGMFFAVVVPKGRHAVAIDLR